MAEKKNMISNDTVGDKDCIPPSNGESGDEYDPLNFEVVRKVTRSGGRAQVRCIPPRSLKKNSTFASKRLGLNDQDLSSRLRQRSQHQIHINEHQENGNRDGLETISNDKNMSMADFILHKKQQQKGKEVANNYVNSSPHFGPDTHNESSSCRRLNFQGVRRCLEEDLLAVSLGVVMTEGKTRGSTMLHDVHMRPYKKRKAIFLNEFDQPIGPITEKEDTVSEFSLFLGTIARDYGYAPFVYNTWRKVPNKEKMWEYVLV
ncbi:hypothetical protein KSS87_016180 [Heliosperma pusillum]|nr:hypothetical protein KSS87_016180 [Heliosperma pusillum]